uniref:ATP synthase F0 subunit 8 n=1 Tax=Euclimacia badia TaxID=2448034 RepID=UPI000EF3030E|nr:ATP synthase F0 subunit 8 [Euclimacia badia]AYG51274.1 ATP synthase F0 subunit 8 [Euclimacia badia]
MPQMSPLSWWLLFIYFILILFMFNMMNYYIIMYNSPFSMTKKFFLKTLNWKW